MTKHNFKVGDQVIITNSKVPITETFMDNQPITVIKLDDVGDTALNILIEDSRELLYWVSSDDIALAEPTLTQPEPKGYMIFVENQSRPKHIHQTYDEAVTEAHRLAKQPQNINYKVYILTILEAVVGTVSVNQVDLTNLKDSK